VTSGVTLGTEQATTSGTSIDFTIPATAKIIHIILVGVSTSGTSDWLIQLGDAGGIETTGYLGSASGISGAVSTATYTTGICIANGIVATSVHHGVCTLFLEDAANFTWVGVANVGRSDSANHKVGAGSKSLSAALTTVRLTTVNGTDTFDAGAVNVLYQ